MGIRPIPSDGVLDSYSSTKIVIRAGSLVGTYSGSFSYDSYGVYGQLQGYKVTYNGDTIINVTNINRDAYTSMEYIDSGNAQGFIRYVLSGRDELVGSSASDLMRGHAGWDTISGGSGNDVLYGGSGADVIMGNKGSDRIYGETGADIIYGGAGADVIAGGGGADRMYGGIDASRDVFVFQAVGDSPRGTTRDILNQFTRGIDDIDLSRLDAKTSTYGDQAFTFSGSTAAANSVWFKAYNSGVVVRADVNGDAIADLEVGVLGVSTLSAGDFIL